MVEVEDIMYYGRFYTDQENRFDVSWWLCTDDYEVYHTDALLSVYSYEDISEIAETLRFIPFFKTDIIAIEKDFMKKLNNRSCDRMLENILSNESVTYDVAFRMFIERSSLTDSWRVFESAQLKNDAVKWCRENHIPCCI